MSVIGIDLGTCFTRVGVFNSGSFQIIENSSERQTLNYVVIKPKSREMGEIFRAKIRTNFKKTIFDSKGIFIFKCIIKYEKILQENSKILNNL
jgi:molecular chaperone DnaK (HSP70)